MLWRECPHLLWLAASVVISPSFVGRRVENIKLECTLPEAVASKHDVH